MESRLFQSIDIDDELTEVVRRSVDVVARTARAVWIRLVDDLPNFVGHKERGARQAFIDRQLKELAVGRDTANAVVSLAQLVMNGHNEARTRDDDPSVVVNDLLTIAERTDGREALVDFVNHAIATAPRFRATRERAELTQGVLPTLSSFGTTVELRAMMERQFKPGDDLTTYLPRVVGMIPIASVRLLSDEDEVFAFQCDREDLQSLVHQLQATLKELDALAGSAT